MLWLKLPYGWGETAGTFRIVGSFIAQRRNAYSPSRPGRDGAHAVHSVMFVDDAIMVDLDLGLRLKQVSHAWGDSCRVGIWPTAVSEAKKTEEEEGGRRH